jgi:hypothetical protein
MAAEHDGSPNSQRPASRALARRRTDSEVTGRDRPLAVLGSVGYLALFASGWLYIAGHHSIAPLLYVPRGTFEFVLGLLLIVKGFRESAPGRHDHARDEL